jgi:superfamily I DNA and/or RNA helicase
MGIKEGHFKYIIIDEAAQAFEPEIAMCCKYFSLEKTQIILAGDYNQLNPVVRTPGNPLQMSLQERLSKDYLIYKKTSNFHTMLTKNYRSHQKIFQLSSELFYSNKLEKFSDDNLVNSLCEWEGLKNKKFPILFQGVKGKEYREGESASWMNPEEVSAVVKMTENLLKSSKVNVEQRDIAIITPYRKQVQKIRFQLRKRKLGNIRVGTVEDYQGQESKIVILSTVRSNPKMLSMDEKNSVGIVNHSKRFNVALTRAQSLMIVIGDPDLLKNDKNWFKFLVYVEKNENITGCEIPREIKIAAQNSFLQELAIGCVENILESDSEEEIFCTYIDDLNWKF